MSNLKCQLANIAQTNASAAGQGHGPVDAEARAKLLIVEHENRALKAQLAQAQAQVRAKIKLRSSMILSCIFSSSAHPQSYNDARVLSFPCMHIEVFFS